MTASGAHERASQPMSCSSTTTSTSAAERSASCSSWRRCSRTPRCTRRCTGAESTFPQFESLDIRTSFLDRAAGRPPFPRPVRAVSGGVPVVRRDRRRARASRAPAAGRTRVRTSPRAFHAVYCYTPARWLYGDYHDACDDPARARAVRAAVSPRSTSRRGAARTSTSRSASHVRDRIRQRYGRDAPVVHPPVDVERFTPRPRGERLLVVSRLLPYKRVDLVVDAATRAGSARRRRHRARRSPTCAAAPVRRCASSATCRTRRSPRSSRAAGAFCLPGRRGLRHRARGGQRRRQAGGGVRCAAARWRRSRTGSPGVFFARALRGRAARRAASAAMRSTTEPTAIARPARAVLDATCSARA